MSIDEDYSVITRKPFHYLRHQLGHEDRIGTIVEIAKPGIALFQSPSPSPSPQFVDNGKCNAVIRAIYIAVSNDNRPVAHVLTEKKRADTHKGLSARDCI